MTCYLSSIFKSEDPAEYARKANSGMMLGFPVKIGGKEARPDNNIHYHSTIKVFNPASDHLHEVHHLAKHLILNPPDPKTTQIEPTTFQGKNGDTIHVIKLHGRSADKIKEHNGKFAHMGDSVPYEFQPHVSLDKATWDKIKNSGAKTAHEARISFGNAELKRGPQTIKTYHHEPDSSEPRVPDESDITAKIPYEPQFNKSEDVKLVPMMKPFVSEAQRRWGNSPSGKKALGGEAGVHEWNEATKGKKLPEKVAKSQDLEKSENSQPIKPQVKINPEHGKTIANAYESMKHDPHHPDVKAAYGALIGETNNQFKDLMGSGLKISKIKPGQSNPYKSSKDMHQDVKNNKHLWYFPTDQGFGDTEQYKDHPMLQHSGYAHEGQPLLANDVFRIVHDINGHHAGGESGFGPTGEQQAYLTHKKMYSPLANKALFTETAGQNNWVNHGPHAEWNKQNPAKTKFAEQKAGLMPDNIINGKWHNET